MKNIMLFCAAGMSTSLLVNNMKTAANQEGYDCTIAAHALSEVTQFGKDADVILLGPQVRYALKKVQAELPDKPVEGIDMRMYGMMDGKGVLGQAKKLMGD